MSGVKLLSVKEIKPVHKSVINEWRFGMVVHNYEYHLEEMDALIVKLKKMQLTTVNDKLADKIRSIIKRYDETFKK